MTTFEPETMPVAYINAGSVDGWFNALREGLAAAGVDKLPPKLQELEDLWQAVLRLSREPRPRDIAGRAARQICREATVDTLDQIVEDAVQPMLRAMVIDQIMSSGYIFGNAGLPHRVRCAIADARPELIELARPGFNRARDELVKAAAKLPEGEAALDMDAVVEADASSAYLRARDALRDIRAIANLVGPVSPVAYEFNTYTHKPGVATLVKVVRLPRIDVLYRNRMSTQAYNPPDSLARRRTYNQLFQGVEDGEISVDLALVSIARGDYPGAELDLATRDELPQRARWAMNSMVVEYVDDERHAQTKIAEHAQLW